MLGRIEGRRRRGQQRKRWLNGIINSTDMSLGKPVMLQSVGSQRVGHYLETTTTDVSQAEASYASAQSQRISAEGNLEASRAIYKKVIGEEAKDIKDPKEIEISRRTWQPRKARDVRFSAEMADLYLTPFIICRQILP